MSVILGSRESCWCGLRQHKKSEGRIGGRAGRAQQEKDHICSCLNFARTPGTCAQALACTWTAPCNREGLSCPPCLQKLQSTKYIPRALSLLDPDTEWQPAKSNYCQASAVRCLSNEFVEYVHPVEDWSLQDNNTLPLGSSKPLEDGIPLPCSQQVYLRVALP